MKEKDIIRKLIESTGKPVLCFTSDISEDVAESMFGRIAVITGIEKTSGLYSDENGCFHSYAVEASLGYFANKDR